MVVIKYCNRLLLRHSCFVINQLNTNTDFFFNPNLEKIRLDHYEDISQRNTIYIKIYIYKMGFKKNK